MNIITEVFAFTLVLGKIFISFLCKQNLPDSPKCEQCDVVVVVVV